jgi:hypothetical protein
MLLLQQGSMLRLSGVGGCEMSDWMVPVSVALIGGPLMWGLTRFDRRNTVQHVENKEVLDRIEGKVDSVAERLHDHIDWHLEGNHNKKGVA